MQIIAVALARSQMPKVNYFRDFWGANTQKTRMLSSLATVEILGDYILI